MELTGVVLLVAAVTGIVELVKRAVNFEWRAVAIIASAALAGFIIAPAAEIGLTALQGLVVGFGASGFITIAQNIGSKGLSTVAEIPEQG